MKDETTDKMSRSERMKLSGESELGMQTWKEKLKGFPVGFYILALGAIWAVVMLIRTIFYFF